MGSLYLPPSSCKAFHFNKLPLKPGCSILFQSTVSFEENVKSKAAGKKPEQQGVKEWFPELGELGSGI